MSEFIENQIVTGAQPTSEENTGKQVYYQEEIESSERTTANSYSNGSTEQDMNKDEHMEPNFSLSGPKELTCVGQNISEIPGGLNDSFGSGIERVDLSYNCLKNVAPLHVFSDSLKVCVLDNNELDDSFQLPSFPNLHSLSLNKNSLKNLEVVINTIKMAAPDLTFLSLLGNEACPNELMAKDEDDYQRYRLYVINQMPNLKFLDSRSVTAEERTEAKKGVIKVARLTEEEIIKQALASQEEKPNNSPFSPLPENTRGFEDVKASIGVSKYVYHGRHSEGNRFIRNSDL